MLFLFLLFLFSFYIISMFIFYFHAGLASARACLCVCVPRLLYSRNHIIIFRRNFVIAMATDFLWLHFHIIEHKKCHTESEIECEAEWREKDWWIEQAKQQLHNQLLKKWHTGND